jgi:hypothetical protein
LVLPGGLAEDAASDAFAVRAVFLDGTEPVDLVEAVTRFGATPRALPDDARDALTALREDWHLLTLEEELARERALVAMYAEALDAMTKSRDLYREAAERAHEALAAYRESADGQGAPRPPAPRSSSPSPLQQLTRTLERLKAGSPKARRPAPGGDDEPAPEPQPTTPDR